MKASLSVVTTATFAAAIVAAAQLPIESARADVLFDNFGPGDTYSLDSGATLAFGGPLGGEQHEASVSFTVTGGDFFLDTAEVAVLHSWGPDLVHVHLQADDNGRPGAILESTTATGVTPPFVWSPPMVAEFSGSTLLEDGRQYWIALATEETDALLAWSQNVVDDFGLRGWRVDQGEWQVWEGIPERSVLRVNGTPASGGGPELTVIGDCPGSMTFTSTGNTFNGNVAFAYATGTGSFILPGGPCAGTQLGLNQSVRLAQIATANPNGVAEIKADIPLAACGRVFAQTVDATECATSNVVGL